MNILDRIKAKSKKLTDADQKLVATMLTNRAEAAFLSGPQIAQRAGVHEATATRLAQKLGYKGFPDLRAELQRFEHRHRAAHVAQRASSGGDRMKAPAQRGAGTWTGPRFSASPRLFVNRF